MAESHYALDLPDPGKIRELLSAQVDYWRPRNAIVGKFRDALEGRNPIAAPTASAYKVVVKHAYFLAAAHNEKLSRFMDLPQYQFVPIGNGSDARDRSTRMENWSNRAVKLVERNSAGDIWRSMLYDTIALDGGVERIERAPSAFWPDMIPYLTEGEEEAKDNLSRVFEDEKSYNKAKEEYKKKLGLPIRSVHVPFERFMPHYEGRDLIETFELEQRTVRQVLGNKLFDTSALERYRGRTSVKDMVTILHYGNQGYHAYYALAPEGGTTAWPRAASPDTVSIGTPVLLHAYEHDLGRPLYNHMGGRGGGWKGAVNRIEGVMTALLDLSEFADEILSQMATYARATMWPNLVAYYDVEARGADEGLPKPLRISEGQNVAMWSTERLESIFKPQQFPVVDVLLQQVKERIAQLAGSDALYGVHQPGVSTGYHEAFQVAQARHLDNQLEYGIARGAEGRLDLILRHARAMDETLYAFHADKDAKGNYKGDYMKLDPKRDLDPWPQFTAKVMAPAPQDIPANIRATLDATMDRGEKGPLLDDGTALEMYMGIPNPDDIERRKVLEREKRNLLNSGFIQNEVQKKVGMVLMQRAAPSVGADQVADASPAVQQALTQMNTSGETDAMGGIEPQFLMDQQEGMSRGPSPYTGRGGGNPPNVPQPNQQQGRASQLMQGGP